MNPFTEHLYIFLMFIPILTVHEAAHAWVAHLLGDDTARDEGRLTLDPISHIDLWGTILVPAMNILVSSSIALIGWGRPVPVNAGNLRHWRRDEIVIALAGPAANFLLALAAVAAAVYLLPVDSPWQKLVGMFAFVSTFLALFNLCPVPPLDGWPIARNLFRLSDPGENGRWLFLIVFVLFLLPPVIGFVSFLSHAILYGMQAAVGGGGTPLVFP